MKVVWICHFSNPEIREKLDLSINFVERMARKLATGSSNIYIDFAQWISNGIKELEEFNNVELHVISPHYGINKKIFSFELENVNYHFFKSDDDSILKKLLKRISESFKSDYQGNRKIINELVNAINPDIIHMYGAENPYYSISALDVDTSKYPFIVSLQTLMSYEEFKVKNKGNFGQYGFRTSIEKKILSRVNYIGSTVPKFREIVWREINPDAIFFRTYLAVEEKVELTEIEKKYDFVYFSASINKAADYAIEAFAIAAKKCPNLTLNIIGGTPQPYTNKLKLRIKDLGIEENVFFTGRLETHKEVLDQIKLSKYALIPLKTDIISGTLREAIFSGLPVVSTITEGTPELNRKRESVLLSEQGDHKSMANNMIKLRENPDLAKKISENAIITAKERWNNKKNMSELIYTYKAIIDHHKNGNVIPKELCAINPNIKY